MNPFTKSIVLLCVFAIFGLGAVWVNHTIDGYQSRAKLRERTQELESTRRSIDHLRTQQLMVETKEAAVRKEVSALQALKDREAELKTSLEQLKKDTEFLSNKAVETDGNLSTEVMGVRSKHLGNVLPTLALNNGKVLNNVKITKINEDLVSVTHSVGSSRLANTDLPAIWVEKFQLQDPPPKLPPPTAAPGADPNIAAAPAPSRSAPAPGQVGDMKLIQELRSKIARATAQVHILRNQESAWNRRAWELEAKFSNSEAKGRIVTNKDRVESARASAQKSAADAALIEAQIITLNSELMTLNGATW